MMVTSRDRRRHVKAAFTHDTLKPGTNRWVCYDQSGEPNEQPFSVQGTSVGNLERVAQNRRFESTQSTGLPDNNKQGGAWIMNAGTTTAHIIIPGS
jgi:hypothetical protein